MVILLIFHILRKLKWPLFSVGQPSGMNSSTSLVKLEFSQCLTFTKTSYGIWTRQRKTNPWWVCVQKREDSPDVFGLHRMLPNWKRRIKQRVDLFVWSWYLGAFLKWKEHGSTMFLVDQNESRFWIVSRILSKKPQRSISNAKETWRTKTQVEKE